MEGRMEKSVLRYNMCIFFPNAIFLFVYRNLESSILISDAGFPSRVHTI